jgi:hypothetical protein
MLALSRDAWPSPGSPSARLVYGRSAEAASCPAEPALRTAVAARFGYDPFFPWAKATIVVQVSRVRSLYVSRVQLLDEHGIAQGLRELSSSANDCSEIFDATALAISIALDAASKPSAPEPAQEAPEPPAPDRSFAPPPSTPPPVSQAPSTEPAPAPALAAPTSLRVEAGVDVSGSIGVSPSISPGVLVFARGRVRQWSLSLELQADWPESATRQAELGGGRVESWIAGAGLASCLHAGRLVACATGMVGSLRASGHDIDPQFSKDALSASAGGRVGLEWPISSTLALRVHVDGAVNLVRVHLALGRDDVWSAPPLSGTLGGGLIARFR